MNYTKGIANFTNGSATVTGYGGYWTNDLEVGDWIASEEALVFYKISAVVSDTELTLSSEYTGDSIGHSKYIAITNFSTVIKMYKPSMGDRGWDKAFSQLSIAAIDELLNAIRTFQKAQLINSFFEICNASPSCLLIFDESDSPPSIIIDRGINANDVLVNGDVQLTHSEPSGPGVSYPYSWISGMLGY